MFMTDKKLIAATEEIVRVHAPLILKELGLEENDGILDRIYVLNEITEDNAAGRFQYTTTRISRSFGLHVETKYNMGSGHINLYPVQNLFYQDKNKTLKKLPMVNVLATIAQKQLKKQIIEQLAHELRHYWQFYTGMYFEKEIILFGRQISSYEFSWCESDANEFAAEYRRSLN